MAGKRAALGMEKIHVAELQQFIRKTRERIDIVCNYDSYVKEI
jgi:hypothetical protein